VSGDEVGVVNDNRMTHKTLPANASNESSDLFEHFEQLFNRIYDALICSLYFFMLISCLHTDVRLNLSQTRDDRR